MVFFDDFCTSRAAPIEWLLLSQNRSQPAEGAMPRFVVHAEAAAEPGPRGEPVSVERRELLILKSERECLAVDRRASQWTKFGAASGVGPERGITLTCGDAKEEEIFIEDPELDAQGKDSALVQQLRKGVKGQTTAARRKE